MARVHLIENNKDIDLAKRFEIKLRDRHTVSWDINFLVPGQEWRRSLQEAVLAANGLIAIFTKNSVSENSNRISSQFMAADIGAAKALGKFIIPVIIGTEVSIPALVDDIFVARASSSDGAALDQVIVQVDAAIEVLTRRQEKKLSLGLLPAMNVLRPPCCNFMKMALMINRSL